MGLFLSQMVGDYEVSSEIYSESNYITKEKPKLDKKSKQFNIFPDNATIKKGKFQT